MIRKVFFLFFPLFLMTSCVAPYESRQTDSFPFLKNLPDHRKASYTVFQGRKKIGYVWTSSSLEKKGRKFFQEFRLPDTHIVTESYVDPETGSLLWQEKRVNKRAISWDIKTRIAGVRGLIVIRGQKARQVALELSGLVYDNDTLLFLLEYADFKAWAKQKRRRGINVMQPQLGQVVPMELFLREKKKNNYEVKLVVGKKEARAYYATNSLPELRYVKINSYRFYRSGEGGNDDTLKHYRRRKKHS